MKEGHTDYNIEQFNELYEEVLQAAVKHRISFKDAPKESCRVMLIRFVLSQMSAKLRRKE